MGLKRSYWSLTALATSIRSTILARRISHLARSRSKIASLSQISIRISINTTLASRKVVICSPLQLWNSMKIRIKIKIIRACLTRWVVVSLIATLMLTFKPRLMEVACMEEDWQAFLAPLLREAVLKTEGWHLLWERMREILFHTILLRTSNNST